MQDSELHDLVDSLRGKGEPFAVATVVRTVAATAAKAGAKAVVTADGTLHGFIGGGCVTGAVKRTAALALADGRAHLISVLPRDEFEALGDNASAGGQGVERHRSNCPSGGTMDVFIEPMLPAPELVICGASPVAAGIADLAPRIGFAVTAVAPEAERHVFAAGVRGIDSLAALTPAVRDRFIIVATQGKRDFDMLKAALETDIPFVAFVGSRRKAAALKARLAESGLDAARLARLTSPAGVWIGAITPEEIALSILADVVRARRLGARDAASETGRGEGRTGNAA
jgi:xanthine dehydrogenase accessory factor